MAAKTAKKPAKKSAAKKAKGGKRAAKRSVSKSAILNTVAESAGVKKSEAQKVVDALIGVGHAELNAHGVFVLPGFAKFVVKKVKAKPARWGRNPFTGEEMKLKAKPASKTVR